MSKGVSAALERLCKLFEEVGYDTEQPLIMGELEAYCEGIDMVNDYIGHHLINIFLELGTAYDAAEYIKLLGGYLHSNGQQLRASIHSRLGSDWGMINLTDFSNALKNISRNLKYNIVDGEYEFYGTAIVNLTGFGKLAEGYLPIGTKWSLGNNPSSFDEWDMFAENWNKLDSFCFPFDVIDRLGV